MLILASASPRRQALLEQIGLTFTVESVEIDETPQVGEDPLRYVQRLAEHKAAAVLARHRDNRRLVVLGADTTVVCNVPDGLDGFDGFDGLDRRGGLGGRTTRSGHGGSGQIGQSRASSHGGQILGKPTDAADAARMLRLLSGTIHHVMTGVALLTARTPPMVAVEVTEVEMDALTDQQIADYIATGEPMGKAGAYAIQGRAARFVPGIRGCYSNVVGLPLARVHQMLADLQLHL